MDRAMKIFAAGIAAETNTFASIPTGYSDFLVQRGRDVLEGRIDHPSLDLSAVWGRKAREAGHAFVFGLMAWAMPSGKTTRGAYERLRDELLETLFEALPVDIVLLNLHGAMVAEGYEDCERDIIERVRALVGRDATIAVEFDLHCNLSEPKIEQADLVILYKEYPHVDINDRALEVLSLALSTQRGEIKPVSALFECHMLGMYPTTREPMRGLVQMMKDAEQREGVLSVSFGHGFPHADVAHAGAKVLVLTDSNQSLANSVAAELGSRIYRSREEIGFESFSVSLDEALSRARDQRGTVVIADQSDNPGCGAPGDGTFALRAVLERNMSHVALAIFYDPEVVRLAKSAGIGATLPVRLGGKLGVSSGQPVDVEVSVFAILEDYQHPLIQESGEPWYFPCGDVVALRIGSVDIVVGSIRCQCFTPAIFGDLGVDPTAKRLLVVKSTQHFHAAFAPLASKIIYMTGPGGASPDPRNLQYRQLVTSRLYPWVVDPLGKGG